MTKDQMKAVRLTHLQDVPAIYANFIELTCSPFDFEFRFGEMTHDSSTNRRLIKDKILVRVSPENASLFLRLLKKQIETYEKAFAEIPDVAKNILEALEPTDAN